MLHRWLMLHHWLLVHPLLSNNSLTMSACPCPRSTPCSNARSLRRYTQNHHFGFVHYCFWRTIILYHLFVLTPNIKSKYFYSFNVRPHSNNLVMIVGLILVSVAKLLHDCMSAPYSNNTCTISKVAYRTAYCKALLSST